LPKIVAQVLIVVVSAGILLAGLWMIFWSDAAARRFPDFRENSTPNQARWNVRMAGAVFVLFGWAGLYLIFVEGLKPFPPGENGVGF
jgi:Na+/proline symporter